MGKTTSRYNICAYFEMHQQAITPLSSAWWRGDYYAQLFHEEFRSLSLDVNNIFAAINDKIMRFFSQIVNNQSIDWLRKKIVLIKVTRAHNQIDRFCASQSLCLWVNSLTMPIHFCTNCKKYCGTRKRKKMLEKIWHSSKKLFTLHGRN